MTIEREDMDRREVDFSDVVSGRLPPVRPDEVPRDRFPKELGVHRLAHEIKVSRPRLNDIVLERRAVTTAAALWLGAISGRRRSSGSTFGPVTIWMSRSARYAVGSSGRLRRAPHDVSATNRKP